MSLVEYFFILFGALIIAYLTLPFFTVIATFFVRERKVKKAAEQKDLACIITAYGDNIKLVMPVIHSLLCQTHQRHLIYLVADNCETADIDFPSEVVLIKPVNRMSSKVKAFILAIENFKRPHDAIVIFDPDNVARQDFLSILNDYLCAGFRAVQGRRTAKNLDSIYACGDATGEIYKNYIERYAPFVLGSSPTIAGSGMAVDTALFKQYLVNKKIRSGLDGSRIIVEDKILQNVIVGMGLQIAFAKDAILYDEKVSSAKQVQRQRSRWLYSYFVNAPHTFGFIIKGGFKLNWNQFLFGLITSTLPMFILWFGSILFLILSFFVSQALFLALSAAILIFLGNIFLVLAISRAPMEIWKAIWSLPLFIFRQLLALFQMKLSRKEFLVTKNEKALTLSQIEKGNAVKG